MSTCGGHGGGDQDDQSMTLSNCRQYGHNKSRALLSVIRIQKCMIFMG